MRILILLKLSQIKINPNKSFSITNLNKDKKKLFRKLVKNQKKLMLSHPYILIKHF